MDPPSPIFQGYCSLNQKKVISEILRVMDFVHLEALAYLRLDAYAEAAEAENMWSHHIL